MIPTLRGRIRMTFQEIRFYIHCSWPIRAWSDIRASLRNMIFRGHNNVKLTKFSGKDWVETDERLFEAVFECLREFVEDQKAWMEVVFQRDIYGMWTYWKMRYLPNRFRRKLSRELALKYLDWEINETDEYQSNSAKKIKELYLWYIDEYNTRSDPWDQVPEPPGGWSSSIKSTPVEWDEDGVPTAYEVNFKKGETPDWKLYNERSKWAYEEEERRYQEATEKAIEVLKIRQSLWT